jgi:hypothetical protein
MDKMTEARMEPDLSTILTKSEGELLITLGANGKGNYKVVQKGGSVIGDAADVLKVQTLGTFINDERKAVLKTSVSMNTKKFLAAIVAQGSGEEATFAPVTMFPKSFLDAFRSIYNQMDILSANAQAVSALTTIGDANALVKNHLVESAARIRQAIGAYVQYRASLSDDMTPQKLNVKLFLANVLSWVFTKLTSQKLTLGGKDFEFRRVYFPKDPVKGLSLTWSEWTTDTMRNSQGGILHGMETLGGMWGKDLVAAFLSVPDWDLGNFDTGAPARVLMNVPMMIVPFDGAMTASECYTALGRSGDRGMAWNSGNTITPQDTLKFLGTVPKRVFLGLVQKPAFKLPMLRKIFPAATLDANEQGGIYARVATQAKERNYEGDHWFQFSNAKADGNAPLTARLKELLLDIVDVEHDPVLKALVQGSVDLGEVVRRGKSGDSVDNWASLVQRKEGLKTSEVDTLTGGKVDPTWFNRKKRVKQLDLRSARTPLGSKGHALVADLRAKRYTDLALRVEDWLRSFLTLELQGPVAEVIHARLDASLSRPVEYDKSDRAGYLDPGAFDSDDDDGDLDVQVDVEPPQDPDVDEINPDD